MVNYRKKASMQDIADCLGISKNAVSLALSGKSGVSDELREKIFKTAYELNYNGLKAPNKRSNKNILVLIHEYIRRDSFTYFFHNRIFWSIERSAQEIGYKVVFATVKKEEEDELLLPGLYYEMEYCGLLSVGSFTHNYIKMIQQTNLPVVNIDGYYNDTRIDSVVMANEEDSYSIVKYLIEKGHKDIGFIGFLNERSSYSERWSGYNKAMAEHNLIVNENHCILNWPSLSKIKLDPDELVEILSGMESFPTAWFCAGDMVAFTVISALTKMNIKVPDDISIAGFDDIESSQLISPPLTTVHVKRKSMAIEAVELLIRRINTKDNPAKVKISLYGDLVIRNSVKELNNM